jgi:hypothetical protein
MPGQAPGQTLEERNPVLVCRPRDPRIAWLRGRGIVGECLLLGRVEAGVPRLRFRDKQVVSRKGEYALMPSSMLTTVFRSRLPVTA